MSVELINSKRVLRSASYVVAELTPEEQREMERNPSRGIEKLNFIRLLNPSRRELQKILAMPKLGGDLRKIVALATELARETKASQWNFGLAEKAAEFTMEALMVFSSRLAQIRGSAAVFNHIFQRRMRTAPVGRLHLERIEMYPAGTEQGELVFTVPLAPKETVTISHKEWSLFGEEYERIVQDYFESYSERGVAEKTDFSISAENETRHSNALSLSSTVSGGYGPVSITVTAGLNASAEDREAIKSSTQRIREVTEKASARTRQEHKISVKLETKKGAEEASYRTITNPYDDRVLRIDYFRMMRKWRVNLYRYGLRLTYDIPVPNPGARLWAKYRELAELDAALRRPFVFTLKPDDLNQNTWKTEAAKYGAAVEPPPSGQTVSVFKHLKEPQGGMEVFEFNAPSGMVFSPEVRGGGTYITNSGNPPWFMFNEPVLPTEFKLFPEAGVGDGRFQVKTKGIAGGNRLTVFVHYSSDTRAMMTLVAGAKPEERAVEEWRIKAWNTIRDAALQQYNQNLARLQNQRDRLWSELSGADTLSLRRMEREELIRLALLWMIGPGFDATPDDVGKVIRGMLNREQHDKPDDAPAPPAYDKLLPSEWAVAQGFGDYVKFLHHAVEWENMLYFLYPYFWGSDDLAREKLLFDHPDPNHRDFLRAGYARVVVPIRPGFEKDFTKLLETGIFAGAGNSPYLTVAEEVASYARTNYQGIPPANPEKHARPLLYPEQRKTWETMSKVIRLLDTHFKANGAYPDDLGALPGGPFKDAWGRDLVYKYPGSGSEYDLISYGKDGREGGEELDADISAAASASLIATWYDYTPTSGVDIEMTGKVIGQPEDKTTPSPQPAGL